MKVDLIRIGNSRGIRIPKPLIEQCGLRGAVELRVENERLIVSRARKPRAGWNELFQSAAGQSDELLLDGVPPNEFDAKEWKR